MVAGESAHTGVMRKMSAAHTYEPVLDVRQAAKYLRTVKKLVEPAKVKDLHICATRQGGVMAMVTMNNDVSRRFRWVGKGFVDENTIGD